MRGAVVVEGKVQVFRRDGLEEEAARLSRRVGLQLLRVRAHLLQGLSNRHALLVHLPLRRRLLLFPVRYRS